MTLTELLIVSAMAAVFGALFGIIGYYAVRQIDREMTAKRDPFSYLTAEERERRAAEWRALLGEIQGLRESIRQRWPDDRRYRHGSHAGAVVETDDRPGPDRADPETVDRAPDHLGTVDPAADRRSTAETQRIPRQPPGGAP